MNEAEKILVIEGEMKKLRNYLSLASKKILASKTVENPIFVVHKQNVAIGVPILERDKVQTNWSVNLSSVEEFVNKDLINSKKLNTFKSNYKDPNTHLCLFVLSDIGAQFMYLPMRD